MVVKRQKKVLQFNFTVVVYTKYTEDMVRQFFDLIRQGLQKFLREKRWTKTVIEMHESTL